MLTEYGIFSSFSLLYKIFYKTIIPQNFLFVNDFREGREKAFKIITKK